MKRQIPPQISGATATLQEDHRCFWVFTREELVCVPQKSLPGAAAHPGINDSLKQCKDKKRQQINVLKGLELHEDVLSTQEEEILVSPHFRSTIHMRGRWNFQINSDQRYKRPALRWRELSNP
jgi:hypothetical protein